MPAPKNLTGSKFGRLTPLVATAERRAGAVVWACACECGNSHYATAPALVSGSVKSCGCAKIDAATAVGRQSRKHGGVGTRLYSIWKGMRSRCQNPQNPAYPDYGGRGIAVCPSWDDFSNFLADVGAPPSHATLDRIDNDGPYSPENCQWTTKERQANNRRSTTMIEHDGNVMSLADWARYTGIPYFTLRRRIFVARWPVAKALTAPVRGRK